MSNLYRIEDENGEGVAPFLVERDALPAIGDALCLFNYPRIDRFEVVGLKTRRDWQAFDLIHRHVLVVSPLLGEAVEPDLSNVLVFTPAVGIVQRLARAFKIAQEEIEERLALHISHKDLAALALSIGVFDVDAARFDGLAYRDVPITLGDARSQLTMFEGFKLDLAYVRVTSAHGKPFEVDEVFTSAILAFLERPERAEALRAEILRHMGPGAGGDGELPRRVRDLLLLVRDGELTVFLAAQALTEQAENYRSQIKGRDVA